LFQEGGRGGKRLSWDRKGGQNRPPKGPHTRRERQRTEGKREREGGKREREGEGTAEGKKEGSEMVCGPLGVWVWPPHVPNGARGT